MLNFDPRHDGGVPVLGRGTESAERCPPTACPCSAEDIVLVETVATGPLPPPAHEAACKHKQCMQGKVRSHVKPIS